jgi:hypothetical protein
MKYLKFLFTKRFWAVVVNIVILLFFTIGLPSYSYDEWIVSNLWDIEEPIYKILFGVLILGTGIASLLHVYDEFKRN